MYSCKNLFIKKSVNLSKLEIKSQTIFFSGGYMKRISIILFIFLINISIIQSISFADQDQLDINEILPQKGNIELGGSMGTPSGIESRYWFTERIGVHGMLGFTLDVYPIFSLDLLYEQFRFYKSTTWEARFFYGFGGLVSKEKEDIKYNLRIPAGLSFPLYRHSLCLSIYIAPAYELNPEKKFEMNWGIGVRYNFGRASALHKKQRMLKREVDILNGEINSLKHGLDSTKGRLTKTEGELNDAKDKLNIARDKLSSLKERLDKTEYELDNAKNKLIYKTLELDNAKNQLDDVKRKLSNTKKKLDDKQVELKKKQNDLNKAKEIINDAFIGKEKEEEEKKLALKQDELNRKKQEFKKEKKSWERIKKKEAKRRDELKRKCRERGGIINDEGYCTCPENEEWNPDTNRCECLKGFKKNKKTRKCVACEIITYRGKCADNGCNEDENKLRLKKGPHKFVCIKRCRKKHELWSKRKKKCICEDGYYRDEKGLCVPRR